MFSSMLNLSFTILANQPVCVPWKLAWLSNTSIVSGSAYFFEPSASAVPAAVLAAALPAAELAVPAAVVLPQPVADTAMTVARHSPVKRPINFLFITTNLPFYKLTTFLFAAESLFASAELPFSHRPACHHSYLPKNRDTLRRVTLLLNRS